MKTITIVGAGPVGCALSYLLAEEYGYRVNLYEAKNEPSTWPDTIGKSFNLTLGKRGLVVVERMGLLDKVLNNSVPLCGRVIHFPDDSIEKFDYGMKDEVFYSIRRNRFNQLLLEKLAECPNITIHYLTEVKPIDIDSGEIEISNTATNHKELKKCDLVLATDGAYSVFRSQLGQFPFFSSQQQYHKLVYKELLMSNEQFKVMNYAGNYLHCWPRGSSLLLGFPNPDGGFTCSLFMPSSGPHSLYTLDTVERVDDYFSSHFHDIYPFIRHLFEDYFHKPVGRLVNIRCYPWTFKDKLALVGDAAHAIYPYYGQGCNFGLENAAFIVDLVKKYNHDWYEILQEYQHVKKHEAEIIADLAEEHANFLCAKIKHSSFSLRKEIGSKLRDIDKQYVSIHNNVNFTAMSYSKALEIEKHYHIIINELIKLKKLK